MKYKALKYFQWGHLKLDKGQILEITEIDAGSVMVSVQHYPQKNQLVDRKAVKSMVFLGKVEKYPY
ncbi:hypothetical protein KC686_02705 [Candidatus Woesebacteria bacterium]|nr:hypothetical protein [Candidatus Woesebacteria bacterium]